MENGIYLLTLGEPIECSLLSHWRYNLLFPELEGKTWELTRGDNFKQYRPYLVPLSSLWSEESIGALQFPATVLYCVPLCPCPLVRVSNSTRGKLQSRDHSPYSDYAAGASALNLISLSLPACSRFSLISPRKRDPSLFYLAHLVYGLSSSL